MAFAMADLLFGYVNSSTAFLGTIILGNGINYGIIFISRYQELRAEGLPGEKALEKALAGVMRGTGVASVCASAAYATLMLTSFRGFYQFGVMAAFGQIFCWLLTFSVLPALFVVIDRRTRAKSAPIQPPASFAFLRPLPGASTPGSSLCWPACSPPCVATACCTSWTRPLSTTSASSTPSWAPRRRQSVQREHGVALRSLAFSHHRAGRLTGRDRIHPPGHPQTGSRHGRQEGHRPDS